MMTVLEEIKERIERTEMGYDVQPLDVETLRMWLTNAADYIEALEETCSEKSFEILELEAERDSLQEIVERNMVKASHDPHENKMEKVADAIELLRSLPQVQIARAVITILEGIK